MKKITALLIVCCLGLLFAASTCFAQMYTVTDLGTLGGVYSAAFGINASGQVVGDSYTSGNTEDHAFRTAPNSPINPSTDDLGTLVGHLYSAATAINASGQVVGYGAVSPTVGGVTILHAFRTAQNSPINAATDDLGTLGGTYSAAYGINDSGLVVGLASIGGYTLHAFRTAPNSPINPATDDLGTLGGLFSQANGINAAGEVTGTSYTTTNGGSHAFRTAPNSPINPATDDLGTLGPPFVSGAVAINASGQVTGWSAVSYGPSGYTLHAFRTAPNSPINPATDDLGTLGGTSSAPIAIDNFGQVVGYSALLLGGQHAFLYSNGVMHDLNDLIPAESGWTLYIANSINDAGQIVGDGSSNGGTAFLLTPIYKAFVQQPINADGSSVFSAKRGVVPVKFTLTQYDAPTCTLLPATIAITRTAGGTPGSIDESTHLTNADSGSNFRISGCQYIYNLAASSLGVGTYRVDISINGIMVGHAVFALK